MIRAAALACTALLLPLGALLASAGPAGAAAVEVTLPSGPLTVGDRAEVVVTVTGERDEVAGEPRFPAWGESWGDAEIVETGPVVPAFGMPEEGGARLYEQRLVLVAFRPGLVELPPRPIALPGPEGTAELSTPAGLALRIDSVLPEELAETRGSEIEARPPAPPRPLPLGAAFWATFAGGCAVLLGLALLARRGRRAAAPAPHAAPRDELAAALAAAAAAPEPVAGHVALSLALRRFLGRSFEFRAVESTTTEVRRQLRARRAPAAVEARAHEVLAACDRVKFARESTTREALEARIGAAREVAAEIERHLRPPEAGESAPGAGRERAA